VDPTTFQLVKKLESTKELPDNLPTTVTTHTQLLMLSETNSLTPTQVLVNGGKSNSTKNTGLVKSEFKTEETAAETDSQEPRSLLMTNTVEQFQVELETDNGMMLHAQSLSSVRKSELLLFKIPIFQLMLSRLTLDQLDQHPLLPQQYLEHHLDQLKRLNFLMHT